METKPALRWGRFILGALIVAWLFDFLFFQKPQGISILIFFIFAAGVGLLVLLQTGIRPARASLLLLIPIFFFAAVTFVRQEMLTISLSLLMAMLLMALLAASFRGGRWPEYNLADYVVNAFRIALSGLGRSGATFIAERRERGGGQAATRQEAQAGDEAGVEPTEAQAPAAQTPVLQVKPRRKVLPVVRGVVLAVPVVAVLASLLASADPVFSRWLEQALAFLKIENLVEYIFRGIYIAMIAYVISGVYLHAAQASRDERVLGREKAWMQPFLGSTEAGIVLGAVVVLFGVFVAIQFQYFFGGQSNINTQGFTYADYARRGFGELVAVAVISLGLLLGLSAATRREGQGERTVFKLLGVALVGLVLVMLVSAYQRVTLYEGAYGFSRLRTYTHIFIIWLGILLALTVVLELASRLNRFALAALAVAVGFIATLGIINVDSLIVRQNLKLAQAGSELDAAYLSSLSDDAVPDLAAAFSDAPAGELKERLGAALVCHEEIFSTRPEDGKKLPWQAFNLPHQRAAAVMAGLQQELAGYQFTASAEYGSSVIVGNETYPCFSKVYD